MIQTAQQITTNEVNEIVKAGKLIKARSVANKVFPYLRTKKYNLGTSTIVRVLRNTEGITELDNQTFYLNK